MCTQCVISQRAEEGEGRTANHACAWGTPSNSNPPASAAFPTRVYSQRNASKKEGFIENLTAIFQKPNADWSVCICRWGCLLFHLAKYSKSWALFTLIIPPNIAPPGPTVNLSHDCTDYMHDNAMRTHAQYCHLS